MNSEKTSLSQETALSSKEDIASVSGSEAEDDVVTLRESHAGTKCKNLERTPTAVVSEVFDFLNYSSASNVEDIDEVDEDGENVDDVNTNIETDDKKFLQMDKPQARFHSKDSGFASLERHVLERGLSSMYESYAENEDGTADEREDVNFKSADGINYINHFAGPDGNDNSSLAKANQDVYDDVDVSLIPESNRNSNILELTLANTYTDHESDNALALTADHFGTSQNPDEANTARSNQTHINGSSVVAKKLVTLININTTNRRKPPKMVSTDGPEQDAAEASVAGCVQVSKPEEYVINMTVPSARIISTVKQDEKGDTISTGDNVYVTMTHSDISNCVDVSVQDSDYINTNDSLSKNIDVVTTALLDSSGGKTVNVGDDKISTPTKYEDISGAEGHVSSDDDDDEEEEEDDEDSNENFTAGMRSASLNEQAYDTIDLEPVGSKSVVAIDDVTNCNLVPLPDEPSPQNKILSTGAAESVSLKDIPERQDMIDQSPTHVVRRSKLERNPSAEIASDDSSDEDVGIYAESFRRSNWIRVSHDGKLEMKMSTPLASRSKNTLSSSSSTSSAPLNSSIDANDEDAVDYVMSPRADEVFSDTLPRPTFKAQLHKRSNSTTTTVSESEFKNHYVSRRKCLIQRADSQQEYHRLSSRVYDQDKQVVIERLAGNEDLGLHILDSHPAYITSVDPGSAAEKAGICEGQIIVSVNDQNVLFTSHADIVELIQNCKDSVKLGVANSDFQPVRDLQAAVMSGYMYKLGNSAIMKMWKKRYFILRQDNCLYYYKNEQELDPLGALPLCGYTISRHTDTSKDFCFKAEKYRARTYYFMTDSREQLTEWVGALTAAAARSKIRKESFLSVSSHNVGLPALDIRKPECTGNLGKLSPSRRTWRKRYCVLKDACIYCYKDVNSLSALGVAHLHGYTVDVESHPRRKFSFSLQPPDKKMRVFYFSADNETDKKRWVESLIHSIQRWVRADKEAEC